jgi:NhaP-type Na+/H+ or K+/H+ antiporter
MVPTAISLIGTKSDLSTILFIGWFGPRGIASILYVLIVINQLGSIKGHEIVYAVISMTILLSIILHGLSAQPFARLYAKKYKESE